MNKDEESEIYYDLYQSPETSLRHKRKILQTRILKLSKFESESLYGQIGTELLESGKLQESLIFLKRATIVQPHGTVAWIDLATALFKLEKENEAFLYIKKALCLTHAAYSLHNFVIKTLEERDRLEDLENFYEETAKALTDAKSISVLYFNSAENLVGSKNYPLAIKMYKKAIEADSTKSGYHYQYAKALYHEGIFEEAIVAFENVMKLYPTDKLACNNVAYLNYCVGRVEKAREKYEKIIEKGFEIYATYSNFILVLSHLGEDEEVIEKYKALFMPYIQSHGDLLRMIYKEAVRVTEALLQRDDIDEETREFNIKKLKGTNLIFPLLN